MISIDNALKIKGYMDPPELRWLAENAKKSKCIIEIGSYYGRSTRAICDNTDGVVFSIDTYPGAILTEYGTIAISSGKYVKEQFQINLKEHIDSGRLKQFNTSFDEFLCPLRPDFIFIDGDHLYQPFYRDVQKALTFVNGNPLLISGHDYGDPCWPAVKEIVDVFFPKARVKERIWYSDE